MTPPGTYQASGSVGTEPDLQLAPPVIEVEPAPRIRVSASGTTDEEGAATWLSYLTRGSVKPRTLRDWRRRGVGPVFHQRCTGSPVWYRIADLEEWVFASPKDPDENAVGRS